MVTQSIYAKSMEIVGACILCTILVAGLWPFHAPRNNVQWLANETGLHLGRYGSLLSADEFLSRAGDVASGSLEIWLQPDSLRSTHTICAFDAPDSSSTAFSLHQNKDSLRVERRNLASDGVMRTAWFEVSHVFHENSPVFITVALGAQETSVYANGVLVKTAPLEGAATSDLRGRFVLGNSSRVNDNWAGVIRGLAIYQRPLSPVQVAQHYESWMRDLKPGPVQDDSPLALYLFNEGRGTTVRNEIDPATSLAIPPRYFVLHPRFLATPRREYRQTWSYWGDVALNIAGFIPLGVWAVAYFSSVRAAKSPAVLAIYIGFSISLIIEVSQGFLPSRSSGTTDLITNTLGTVIGVTLYRSSVIQNWLTRVRQRGNQQDGDATTHSELETVYSG